MLGSGWRRGQKLNFVVTSIQKKSIIYDYYDRLSYFR